MLAELLTHCTTVHPTGGGDSTPLPGSNPQPILRQPVPVQTATVVTLYDPSMPVDPASLSIVLYPDPILRRRAAPIAEIDHEVRAVARRMIELMDEEEGIGLAAPQVGLSWRMFVTRVPEVDIDELGDEEIDRSSIEPVVYINPTLSNPIGAPTPMREGCLSIPNIRGEVLRPPTITVHATDLEGNEFTRTVSGLAARCVQHEYDHLEGILILDRFTQMARLRNRSLIRALERER